MSVDLNVKIMRGFRRPANFKVICDLLHNLVEEYRSSHGPLGCTKHLFVIQFTRGKV